MLTISYIGYQTGVLISIEVYSSHSSLHQNFHQEHFFFFSVDSVSAEAVGVSVSAGAAEVSVPPGT